ncbi:MAG TPA: hypothetical protein VN457_00690, partial [Chlamydiales bacterium]|nr:hypothetical protein [Chlamydiales bacterium]
MAAIQLDSPPRSSSLGDAHPTEQVQRQQGRPDVPDQPFHVNHVIVRSTGYHGAYRMGQDQAEFAAVALLINKVFEFTLWASSAVANRLR